MSDHVYDDDPRMSIYHELIDHKEINRDSDNKFLRSLEILLERNGRISIRQYRVLQEMYENRQF